MLVAKNFYKIMNLSNLDSKVKPGKLFLGSHQINRNQRDYKIFETFCNIFQILFRLQQKRVTRKCIYLHPCANLYSIIALSSSLMFGKIDLHHSRAIELFHFHEIAQTVTF